eukprot:gnl/Chilomastix_caulleri/6570.p3 GENE.gnl/Chilomastix_caulleri/6570~~gnl/Chilomastix_caulleri/6570.p3  ORF type:complete len:50 (+),score=7.84 gnl/Chilomastix_caulleri/6570:156-305(+)
MLSHLYHLPKTTLRITIETLFPSVKSRIASPIRPFCSSANAACAGRLYT